MYGPRMKGGELARTRHAARWRAVVGLLAGGGLGFMVLTCTYYEDMANYAWLAAFAGSWEIALVGSIVGAVVGALVGQIKGRK